MERPARSKGNIFQFIPGAKPVAYRQPSFSPGREKRQENWSKFKANAGKGFSGPHAGKGFSGPITSIIPAEARRKSRSGSFDAAEPTSPKVSCMGQIIQKHKKLKNKHKNKNKNHKQNQSQNQNQKQGKEVISELKAQSSNRDSHKVESAPKEAKKKPFPEIFKFLRVRKSDADVVFDDPGKDRGVQVQSKAPSLSQMKRFASGRDSLGSFDWTAHMPVTSDDRNYHSDEEGGGARSDGEGDEDSIIIPHSAPIMVVGGGVALEPRKEVNLWKRRTMGPPRPLQLSLSTL